MRIPGFVILAFTLLIPARAVAQTDPPPDIPQLRAAADHGDARAQIQLGLAYEHGTGVAVDKAQALAWYLKAADQGQHMAAFSVGLLLFGGDGLPQDFPAACKWLDIAVAEAPDMERPIYERARDDAARKMTPAQIADAQQQAQAWLAAFRARPVRAGGDVPAPARTKYVPPVYPKNALKSKAEGQVKMDITVAADGTVTDAKVISPASAMFDQSALDAVKQWEFESRPAGAPPVILTVTLTFSLK